MVDTPEPEQIQTPAQYPNATRVENNVAYDISGKALGPIDPQAQPQASGFDFGFGKQTVAPAAATPQAKPGFDFGFDKSQDVAAQPGAFQIRPGGPIANAANIPQHSQFEKDVLRNGFGLDPEKVAAAEASGEGEAWREVGHEMVPQVVGVGKSLINDPTGATIIEGMARNVESSRTPGEIVGSLSQVAGAAHAPEGSLTVPGAAFDAVDTARGIVDTGKGLVQVGSKALMSDARAQQVANLAHESAKAMLYQRTRESQIATEQAVKAREDAERITEAHNNGDPNVTQQQVDDANNRASAAAANSRKAVEALRDAHTARAEAGAEADRMARKVAKKTTRTNPKQDRAVRQAMDDFKKMAPPTNTRQGQYSDQDLQIFLGASEKLHETNPIRTVEDHANAAQQLSDDIDNEVGAKIGKYGKDSITTNVNMDVRDKLAESPQQDFVEDGMNHLSEKYNLIDPSVEEAQKILTDINAMNRGTLKRNFWDVATALRADPQFAARYWAADSLRRGIDGALEERGVTGYRKLRSDQAAIIRVKTALEKVANKGDQVVRGSGESGWLTKTLAKHSVSAGGAVGAGIGGAIGAGVAGPVGAEIGVPVGAGIGAEAGRRLGKRIAPGDMTRDQLADRVHTVKDKGVPITDLEDAGKPAGQYGPPSPVSPVMQMYVPQRENTPLHVLLASHYGEILGKSSYIDLEKRFLDDITDKQNHGVPLEPNETKIITEMNKANATDRIAAQKQLQQNIESGKQLPTATLPDKVEPLLQVPRSGLAKGMDTQMGIVHDIAHAVVADARGLKASDGIRSHIHPENVSLGSLMSTPIDWTDFVGEDKQLDWNKVKSRMADIAATYVAGGVANDLYHDIPAGENHHLGADMKALKGIFKDAGFTEVEANKMIRQAQEDAATVLSKPGVQKVIEDHASFREAGLDNQHHVSPDRLQQIIQDTKGASNEQPTGKPPANGPGAKGPATGNGAGSETATEEGNPAKLRPKGKGPAKGKGEGVRGNEPAKAEPNSEPGPASPKLGAEEPEDLLTHELQTPRKRTYPLEIIDKEGNSRTVEIPAFSTKDAIKIAQKKFPGESSWGIVREGSELSKQIPAPEGYSVPDKPRLTIRTKGTTPPDRVEMHEHGHAMIGLREGLQTEGMLRHTHPDMPGNSAAAVKWASMKDIIDPKTNRVYPEKVAGLMEMLMGGIASDEAFHDIPRDKNNNFRAATRGSDANSAYILGRNARMEHGEIITALHRAVDNAKNYLTKPEVYGVIKENLGRREPDLSRQYHYSPERLDSMNKEIQRRIRNGQQRNDNPGVGGQGGEGHTGNDTGRAAEGPGVNPEALRPGENPKLGGLREQTTGDQKTDQAIRDAGAIPAGRMFPGEPYELKSFHDPKTGSTLNIKATEPITAETVRDKLADSRAKFAAGIEALK